MIFFENINIFSELFIGEWKNSEKICKFAI